MPEQKLDVVQRWVGDSRNWLDQFLKLATSDRAITAIVVLGSAVRKRGHRRSDFDLLVLYQGERPQLHAPTEVDIRMYNQERVEALVAKGHEILCWALKFGHPLYDPLGVWESLADSWRDRIPLPSANEALQRGERSLAVAKEMLEAGDQDGASDLVLAALTQFVRHQLILKQVFPASRPELPDQLRELSPCNPLAKLLEDAMFGNSVAAVLISGLERALNLQLK